MKQMTKPALSAASMLAALAGAAFAQPSTNPFPAQINLSSLNGTNGFVLNGIDVLDESGRSVSSAGDVNGDGFGDLIIGARGAHPNFQPYAGESYVVFGGPGVGAGGVLNLSTLNGTNGFVCNGIDENDFSGRSVSSAGDVNGDGVGDLIIGASLADPNGQSGAGESYIVFGGPGVGAGGVLNLSTLNGTNGFVCNGIDASDRSGGSVSSAGDVNGDGVDDIIIGARSADPNGQGGAGESYVVFGGPGVGAGGVINLSALNGTNGFVCNGIDVTDSSGRSVSSAGDVNGDGVDDLIIGANGADPNGQSAAGESYVVFGGPGVGAGGVLNLSTLNGTNGFICNGIDASDYSGYSVSSAGDVNGDGIDDIIIGAHHANANGQFYAGESYVVFGRASANVWTSVAGGAWGTGSNWQGGVAPSGGWVTILPTIGVTVTGPTGAVFLDSVTMGATAGRTTLDLQPFSYMEIATPLDISASAAIGGSGVLVVDAGVDNMGTLEPDDLVILSTTGVSNAGVVRLSSAGPTPATLDVFGPFTNLFNGHIEIIGVADLAADSISNAGAMDFAFAFSTVGGAVDNANSITISGGSEVLFEDDVANQDDFILTVDSSLVVLGVLSGNGVAGPGGGPGGAVFAKGGIIPAFALQAGIAQFGGDLSLDVAAVTTIEIGGTTPGAGHDQIATLGTLSAGGTLNVTIINGYVPQPGDAYQVLEFSGVSGSFASVVLDPVLVNAGADTSQLLVNGTIFIPGPSCAGDINGDGFTNASDFTILAGNFGASVPPNTSGDLNGDGLVNAADFVILAGDFGCGG